ncbi:MAG: bifunctional phosphopantothenoylcysteine decarboxylase/phosphopantothenate--cysteine ligase CoaBC [Lentimicrobiaceae bacterium]|jgi:phosphopantothenoylcysteine decarboxylase/phosphopantothenate--cysteine ligase|nr:bifunctional phosphopantothenoylcysteine decarboxylase/phosphopantothenate--cysteine ligase CoaBC [Lentimicrobiaceae bacterium]
MLTGKKILIGITGSIAAYKIPLLVRLLKKAGAEVKIIATSAAKDFVTPLTLSVLSGFPVLSEAFDKETGAWNSHVELGIWADLIIFAPVTANSLAKMATGVADNFLLTVYLSAKCPIMLAPAMDLDMYKHESTQENIRVLMQRGHHFIAPQSGELASGLCGEGRMEEPEKILERIRDFFVKKNRFLGKNILITAGPTYEAIDPVRFVGNHSSGLMGVEIANAFAEQGAKVSLVLGPTALKVVHQAIDVIPVISAKEMFDATTALFSQADIAVLSAAVADFRPKEAANTKIKKQTDSDSMMLELVKNEDILKTLGERKQANQFLVGFSLETDHAIENAKKKLRSKNLDLIILNTLEDQGAGFKHNTNKISIIDRSENVCSYDLKSKKEVAADILDFIFQALRK